MLLEIIVGSWIKLKSIWYFEVFYFGVFKKYIEILCNYSIQGVWFEILV